ncbi:MAG: gliding motility-associated C-terminal domain-containing protein [Bacteroidetes bacterium]|nr:gliding motility-associated C-terminal domain-containing protein [Bacteroidota bacterium]HET6243383.1 gliding motility-associated C-terminal domain-containing protein [Bacteroidia bacterium]
MVNLDFFKIVFLLLLLILISDSSSGQSAMKGKEFWLGFLQNNESESNVKLVVTISSEVNTSGTVSIPLQSWESNFSVTAGGSVSINIPTPLGENTTSGVIQNKGIKIISNDDVTVFVTNYAGFTSDASYVIPKQSLRSEYIVLTYNAYSSWPNDMLIVAATDNTIIDIIPSVNTINGNASGVEFSITLNAGQTYLLKSSNGTDISGTQIKAKELCNPFAVFSGAKIANIPTNCVAADHIFHQMLPVDYWGKNYLVTPLNGFYSLRMIASEDNTAITINGVPLTTLNKGNYFTLNNQNGTKQITSEKPLMVAQFLQGSDCSGSGDPAMTILAPGDRKYTKVNFSTLTLSNINNHYLNVVVETLYKDYVIFNGNNIGAGFIPFPSSNSYSYQQIEINPGYHSLEGDSGIIANVFGTGGWNSYFFTVGYKEEDSNHDFTFETPVCAGIPVTFYAQGSGISSCYWDFGDGSNETGESVQHNYALPGTYNVTLIFGKGSSCSDTITKIIEVPLAPLVDVIKDTAICGNTPIIINAQGNANSFLWSTGDTTSYISTSDPGIYWLKTSNEICTTIDTIIVKQFIYPKLSLEKEISLCQNNEYELNPKGENSLKYTWSTGETSMVINVNQEGFYWVEASNYCGTVKDSTEVRIKLIPPVDAGKDTTILLGTSAQLNAIGGVKYAWNSESSLSCLNCASPNANPKVSTTYYVMLTGDNGCKSIDSVTVFVDPNLLVFVPNIFSPNGDGNNDILYIRGKGIKSINLYIYNRWGEKVFESSDLNQGWDGTFRGQQLPPSVFVFYLDAFLETNQRIIQKGDITLIR